MDIVPHLWVPNLTSVVPLERRTVALGGIVLASSIDSLHGLVDRVRAGSTTVRHSRGRIGLWHGRETLGDVGDGQKESGDGKDSHGCLCWSVVFVDESMVDVAVVVNATHGCFLASR